MHSRKTMCTQGTHSSVKKQQFVASAWWHIFPSTLSLHEAVGVHSVCLTGTCAFPPQIMTLTQFSTLNKEPPNTVQGEFSQKAPTGGKATLKTLASPSCLLFLRPHQTTLSFPAAVQPTPQQLCIQVTHPGHPHLSLGICFYSMP